MGTRLVSVSADHTHHPSATWYRIDPTSFTHSFTHPIRMLVNMFDVSQIGMDYESRFWFQLMTATVENDTPHVTCEMQSNRIESNRIVSYRINGEMRSDRRHEYPTITSLRQET